MSFTFHYFSDFEGGKTNESSTMVARSISTNLKGYTLTKPFIWKFSNDCRRNNLCSSRKQFHPAATPVVEGTIPFGGEGLAVGQYAHTQRVFLSRDIHNFADIVGDHNPLHQSLDTSRVPADLSNVLNGHPLIKVQENGMTKEVVHGILLSSLFSSIFGTLIPGSVYRSQTLEFRRPVFVQELVVGRVEILQIEQQRRLDGLLLRCNTHILKQGKECVRGEAEVWIRHGTKAERES